MSKVLVLNADYIPFTTIPVERAIVLVLQEKAVTVSPIEGKQMRSKYLALDYPSVIKLRKYVNIPYKKIELKRYNVFKRDNYTCAYCGSTAKELTVDHVIPRAQGGITQWNNLVTACKPCNAKKDDKTPDEAEMPLIYAKPHRPSFLMFLSKFNGRIREDWKKYLMIA